MKKIIMERGKRLNQKGIALIWVYLLSAFLTTMTYSFYSLNLWQTKSDVIDSSTEIQAFYLAESAVDEMYYYINTHIGGTELNSTVNISGNLGTGRIYSASYDPNTRLVNAIGTASLGNGSMIKKLTTKIVIATPFDVPPAVKAGLTVSSHLTLSGLLIIDGRNHSTSGVPLNDNLGMPGVAYYPGSSGEIYPQIEGEIDGGIVSIGGPTTAPSIPVNPTSLLAIGSTNYLTSPEAVFGLTAGSLDSYKTSEPPALTVNGIYYYAAPAANGGTVNFNLGTTGNPGTGALIIDNAQNPNLAVNISGFFNGVLIVRDGSFNLGPDTTIAGALVNVSPAGATVSISGPDINSGANPAQIYYCKQCIQSSSLPQGLNNSLEAIMSSWVNYRAINPLLAPPAPPPSGSLND